MTEHCDYCGTINAFLFECDHCDKQYCAKHSKPTAHHCSGRDQQASIDDIFESKPESVVAATTRDGEPDRSVAILRSVKATALGSAMGLIESSRRSLRSVTVVRRINWLLTVLVLTVVLIIALASGLFLSPADPAGPTFELQSTNPDVLLGGNASTATPGGTTKLNETAVERSVYTHVNQRRTNNDVPPLEYDSRLADIARYHSTDMGEHNYMAHVSPTNETILDRYDRFGYECDRAGEVILYTYFDRTVRTDNGTVRYETTEELAKGIVRSWMRSTPHRQVILEPAWDTAGVGIYITDHNRVYVTQNFC